MRKQLKGKELEERAKKLGVSFYGLGTQSGLIDEAELQKRVREDEKLRHKWLLPLTVAIVAGLVVAIIVMFFLEPFKEKVASDDKTTKIERKNNALDHNEKMPNDRRTVVPESSTGVESAKNKKKDTKVENHSEEIRLQSYTTRELFDGDLTITLNSYLEVVNRPINITVSKKGKKEMYFENIDLGRKRTYENYEITFKEIEPFINSYVAVLRIDKL